MSSLWTIQPNDPLNRLVNITLYNVVMRGNSGHGISMPTNGLSKLRAAPLKSSPAFAPSSFVFENLLIDGGGEGGIYWCALHLPVYCLCPALPCAARTSVAKSSLGSVCRDNMGEKTAAGQLLVRNATIRATQQAGLQVEGLAADHIQIRLEHVRLSNVATAYNGPCEGALPAPPAFCNGSASLSPIVLGAEKQPLFSPSFPCVCPEPVLANLNSYVYKIIALKRLHISPVISVGDPEHGNIVEDFLVGTVAFGPGCVVPTPIIQSSFHALPPCQDVEAKVVARYA